jgi:hypothetical protein
MRELLKHAKAKQLAPLVQKTGIQAQHQIALNKLKRKAEHTPTRAMIMLLSLCKCLA